MIGSISTTVVLPGAFGIGLWGDPRGKTWWAKLTVLPVWRIGNWFVNARYWLKCRLLKRYQHHIVHTGLKPGWCDVDRVMLHAMFALLDRYVEWECGGVDKLDKWSADIAGTPDTNAPEGLESGQVKRQNEAAALYRWWHETYPAEQKQVADWMHDLYSGRSLLTEPVEGTSLVRLVPQKRDPDAEKKRKALWALEEKIAADEQAMLHRLVDIRGSLWT